MSTIYRIPVTAEHIAQGKPNAPCDCALAIACKSQPGIVNASVRPGRLRIYLNLPGDQDYLSFQTDYSITQFINAFDSHLPVQPGTLILDSGTTLARIEYPHPPTP